MREFIKTYSDCVQTRLQNEMRINLYKRNQNFTEILDIKGKIYRFKIA